jgi:Ca2+-binding EF-hand superfamily protein
VLRGYERLWAQLSDSQRDAASELGWGASGWDTGDLRPCRDSRWRYLRQQQREAAEVLLFCGRTWELAGAEADRKARSPREPPRGGVVPKLSPTPVSTWALGMRENMTLDELYATAGRVIGFRNMPGVRPAEILQVMRPLLTGHNHDTYELRSAFRAFDRAGDGVVTPAELRTALFDLGGIELNTQQILDLLSTMGGSATDTAVDYLQFARLLAPKRKARLQRTVTQVRATLLGLNVDLVDAFRGFVRSDGYISRRELRTGLFALNAGLTLLQVDDLVDLADSKHNGQIDFDEFRGKLGSTHSVARGIVRTQAELRAIFRSRGVNLREAFQAFDRDGDGVITRYELGSGLRQLNLGLSARQVDEVLAYVDKDGDGRVDYPEFVRQFSAPADDRLLLQQVHDEIRALLRRKRAVGGWYRVLAAFEADDDGRLTKQAFQRGWLRAGLNLKTRRPRLRQNQCFRAQVWPSGCGNHRSDARPGQQAVRPCQNCQSESPPGLWALLCQRQAAQSFVYSTRSQSSIAHDAS